MLSIHVNKTLSFPADKQEIRGHIFETS